MSLSPAAEWLVCVCGDQNIYLVPCYSLLTVRTLASFGCMYVYVSMSGYVHS